VYHPYITRSVRGSAIAAFASDSPARILATSALESPVIVAILEIEGRLPRDEISEAAAETNADFAVLMNSPTLKPSGMASLAKLSTKAKAVCSVALGGDVLKIFDSFVVAQY
jgi:hypothetical protein